MKLKIEDVSVKSVSGREGGQWEQFLACIRDMKVGQSIVIDKVPSQYRLVLSAAPVLLNASFICRKDVGGQRVGRVA